MACLASIIVMVPEENPCFAVRVIMSSVPFHQQVSQIKLCSKCTVLLSLMKSKNITCAEKNMYTTW